MELKRTPDDLAINGGTPAFAEPLHVGRPNIGSKEDFKHRIDDMFERRWLTNDGPYVQELERRLQEHLQVEHCVLVNNGTMGAMIAAKAMGLTGSVIMPAFTFVATAHAMAWLGLTPVFCDIDPKTHNIDPNAIATALRPDTQAIMAVHCWGRPCNTNALQQVADEHGLRLIYDAAHAFSCNHEGTMLGSFGNAEVFSFHATKFFNTFEGGAITTNDSELATKMRLLRNFGFAGYDNVVALGVNGKMTEPCAAMGIANLASLENFIEHNQNNYLQYKEGFAGLPGIHLIDYPLGNRNNYQYIIIEIDTEESGKSRDDILSVLHAENVLARRYFYPGCHRMAPYNANDNGFITSGPLASTEALCNRVLSLPTGTSVSRADISMICSIIRTALEPTKRTSAVTDNFTV